MSRYDNINENALWDSLLEMQKHLETEFHKAAKIRKLSALGPLAKPLRRMHWAAAFLGLTNLADLCAAGAAFIQQLQEDRFRWSVELGAAVKSLIKRTRAFVDARPDEPAAGVFIDSGEAVLPGPELTRMVPVDDLLALFRRRQIDVRIVSSCRRLTVGNDVSFSHAITVPAYAKARHRASRHLTLVYLDLEEQDHGLPAFVDICESAVGNGEILLHGPLGIPWKNYRSYTGKRPYYFLLDTEIAPSEWLKSRGLAAKPIKSLKKPLLDSGAATGEPRVVIREVPAPPVPSFQAPAGPAPSYAAPMPQSVMMGTRSSGVLQELEPEKGRKQRRKQNRHRDENLRIRVSTKLILIVSMLLIISLSVTSLVGVLIFRDTLSTQLEDSNISMSSIVAKQAENELFKLTNSANLLFQVGSSAGGNSALVDDFFANDPGLIYVGVPGSPFQYANRDWFRTNRIFDERVVLNGILEARQEDLNRARNNETVIVNVSPLIPNLESPVLGIGVPFLLGNESQSLVILADIGETLVESVRLQQGGSTTRIVNPDGEILAHTDLTQVFNGANIAGTDSFEKIYTEGLKLGQIEYTETVDGKTYSYLGYYRLIDNFNLGVVTTVLRSDAFRDVRTIIELNIYFGLAILSLAILGVWFFSRSISIPINDLYWATRRIRSKNWDAAFVKPRTKDEVGVLARNFNRMVPDLRATDDLMDKLKVFVNQDVADMIYHDDADLHLRQTKDVTVFFSDVRDFTHMSSAMGNPDTVLGNLSEYFDAMVPCVRSTGGTVDKFIGDAVMAVWGSMGDPLENHAEAAINGALKMREAIMEFNSTRTPGDVMKPPFQIGCGLHSGLATIGLMGSSSKQEWAHMGPTVNLASRIEGANKSQKTDILISPETAARVEGIFDLKAMAIIHPKGVPEPLQLYTVLGRLDDPDRPRSLEELWERLGRDYSNAKAETQSDGEKFKIITG